MHEITLRHVEKRNVCLSKFRSTKMSFSSPLHWYSLIFFFFFFNDFVKFEAIHYINHKYSWSFHLNRQVYTKIFLKYWNHIVVKFDEHNDEQTRNLTDNWISSLCIDVKTIFGHLVFSSNQSWSERNLVWWSYLEGERYTLLHLG